MTFNEQTFTISQAVEPHDPNRFAFGLTEEQDAWRRRHRRHVLIVALVGFVVGLIIGATTAHADDLDDAVRRSAPYMTPEQTAAHVAAARAASRPVSDGKRWHDVTPELLLAMAWVESRYLPGAVSRLECDAAGTCIRRTGQWLGVFPDRFAAPYFCGHLQQRVPARGRRIDHVSARRACNRLDADIGEAYANAVTHLGEWFTFCRRSRSRLEPMVCALAGYNGGTKAARAGRRKYVDAVRARERRLVERWPTPPGGMI